MTASPAIVASRLRTLAEQLARDEIRAREVFAGWPDDDSLASLPHRLSVEVASGLRALTDKVRLMLCDVGGPGALFEPHKPPGHD